MNLSPFVIDENAFDEKTTEISKVYFFYFHDSEQGKYSFRHAYKPDDIPLVVSRDKYELVKAQFEVFNDLILQQA